MIVVCVEVVTTMRRLVDSMVLLIGVMLQCAQGLLMNWNYVHCIHRWIPQLHWV